ncbi:MAG: antitoxin [Amnibacterium sp.]
MADFGGLGDKANEFLKSDKGEQLSDGALDKAGDAVDERTGDRFDKQVDGARDAADKRIGQ